MENLKIHDRQVHFHGAPLGGKVLMVLRSPGVSGQTGWPIGFRLAELTHSLGVFEEAGFEVDFAKQAVGIRIQPFRIQTDARKLEGTGCLAASAFRSHRDADRSLISRAAIISGAAVAEMMVEFLQKTS